MLFLLASLLVSPALCQLDCGVPGTVTQVEVLNISSRTITLRWQPPTDTPTQCVQGYQVCWSAEDDGFAQQCSTHVAITTQVVLTNLAVCANYTVEVTTLGASANSSPTTINTYTGAGPIQSAYTLTLNTTTLTVAWGYDVFTNAPCTSHFEMYVCENESDDLAACENYTIPLQVTPEVAVTGLDTCRQYYVFLFAVDYEGRPSDPNLLYGYVDGLGVATDISFTDVSSSEVYVSWLLPQVNAVCSHDAIVCHVREGGEARVCQSFQTESVTSFTLTELHPCTSYSIQVIILTPGNYFEATAIQHHTHPYNSTMVLWVEAREVSDTQLTMAWEPLYSAPPCVREYSVCWERLEGAGGCASAESSATTLQVTGLEPLTNYTLEVTALLTDGSRSNTATTSAITSTTPTTGSSAAQLTSRTVMALLLSILLFFKNYA